MSRREGGPDLVGGDQSACRPALLTPVLSCQKLKEETGMTLRPWSEALKEYLSVS